MRLVVIWLAAGLWLHFFPPIIKASSLLLIDQFERSNLGEWQVVQNEGSGSWNHCLDTLSAAAWKITNGWMKLVVDGVSCTLAIAPKQSNLLDTEHWQIDFDWRLDESIDMDRNFVWWWQDKDNWYDFKLYGTGIHLQKVVDGIAQPLAVHHALFPFAKDQIYHFTIKYQNQQITLLINQLPVLSTPDQAPFLSGPKTLALKTALGSRRSVSAFDNLQVFSLNSNQVVELGVPYLQQTDPRWANLEYDSAQLWSTNPTLARWGCALVSTVMVMKYHQLHHLPDGQPLTPTTLNEWLLNQPDGFIGNGLLNWLAIARLSGEISQVYATPKLEYTRLEGTNASIVEALNHSWPVILNIPGHFLVGSGYALNPFDFTILDPSYPYRHFKQHQQPLLSGRLFTPSYTDLSYILVASDPRLEIKFVDSAGQALVEQEQFIEELSDSAGQETTRQLITQLRKPPSATYRVKVINSTGQDLPVAIYSYNQVGQLATHQPTSSAQTSATWQVTFVKESTEENFTQLTPLTLPEEPSESEESPEATSDLELETAWGDLLDLVEHWPFFTYCQKLVTAARAAGPANQLRYYHLLHQVISHYPLPGGRRENLLQALNSLNLVI